MYVIKQIINSSPDWFVYCFPLFSFVFRRWGGYEHGDHNPRWHDMTCHLICSPHTVSIANKPICNALLVLIPVISLWMFEQQSTRVNTATWLETTSFVFKLPAGCNGMGLTWQGPGNVFLFVWGKGTTAIMAAAHRWWHWAKNHLTLTVLWLSVWIISL